MKTNAIISLSLAVLLSSAGCGTSSSDEGGDDAGTATGACSDMTQAGTSVTSQNVSGSLPAGQGGTIVPGTYTLTANNYYDTTSSNPPDTVTVAIAESATTGVFDVRMLHGATGCETFTWTVSGTDLSIQMTSPQQVSAGTYPFTASATDIKIYKASANRETVYTLK